MNIKVRKIVAGTALSLSLALGGTLLAGPAQASNNSYTCRVIGGIGNYRAHYFWDGFYQGSGPRRFWSYQAAIDCADWT